MPVLGTKLRAPASRRRLVPRERLVTQLQADPATMPRLVLISAPAGFGKTTRLSQWLTRDRPDNSLHSQTSGALGVGWLSLDAADLDPFCFSSDRGASLGCHCTAAAGGRRVSCVGPDQLGVWLDPFRR